MGRYETDTAPESAGLADLPLQPSQAFWTEAGGSHLALLMYDELRKMDASKAVLLDFLESAYRAGASAAGWDIDALTPIKLEK